MTDFVPESPRNRLSQYFAEHPEAEEVLSLPAPPVAKVTLQEELRSLLSGTREVGAELDLLTVITRCLAEDPNVQCEITNAFRTVHEHEAVIRLILAFDTFTCNPFDPAFAASVPGIVHLAHLVSQRPGFVKDEVLFALGKTISHVLEGVTESPHFASVLKENIDLIAMQQLGEILEFNPLRGPVSNGCAALAMLVDPSSERCTKIADLVEQDLENQSVDAYENIERRLAQTFELAAREEFPNTFTWTVLRYEGYLETGGLTPARVAVLRGITTAMARQIEENYPVVEWFLTQGFESQERTALGVCTEVGLNPKIELSEGTAQGLANCVRDIYNRDRALPDRERRAYAALYALGCISHEVRDLTLIADYIEDSLQENRDNDMQPLSLVFALFQERLEEVRAVPICPAVASSDDVEGETSEEIEGNSEDSVQLCDDNPKEEGQSDTLVDVGRDSETAQPLSGSPFIDAAFDVLYAESLTELDEVGERLTRALSHSELRSRDSFDGCPFVDLQRTEAFITRYYDLVEKGHLWLAAALLPELLSTFGATEEYRRFPRRLPEDAKDIFQTCTKAVWAVEALLEKIVAQPQLADIARSRFNRSDWNFLSSAPTHGQHGLRRLFGPVSGMAFKIRIACGDPDWIPDLLALCALREEKPERGLSPRRVQNVLSYAMQLYPESGWAFLDLISPSTHGRDAVIAGCHAVGSHLVPLPHRVLSALKDSNPDVRRWGLTVSQCASDIVDEEQREQLLRAIGLRISQSDDEGIEAILAYSVLAKGSPAALTLMRELRGRKGDGAVSRVTLGYAIARVLERSKS